MQIVIGIEQSAGQATPPVIPLLRRLDFADPHYDVVHVVPPPIPAGWPAEMVIAAEAMVWHREQESVRFLEWIDRVVTELGVSPDTVTRTVLDGVPADRLTAHADATVTSVKTYASQGARGVPLIQPFHVAHPGAVQLIRGRR